MESPKRNPRFTRRPTQSFRLTHRDTTILAQVFKHRFLRTPHITALTAGSEQGIKRRLQLLYHHGYLDRPPKQKTFLDDSGNKHFVYALGNEGARILQEHEAIPLGRRDWPRKNNRARYFYIEHQLLVSDFMVKLELACRKRGNIKLIEPAAILKNATPEVLQSTRHPFHWTVEFEHDHKSVSRGIIPDKAFGLHFRDEPEPDNKAYFFLEADRGTETPMGGNIHRSFYGKLAAYSETYRQQIHTRRYRFNQFRVLVVTTTAKRVATFISDYHQRRGFAPLLFWFTNLQAFENAPDLLDLVWINGRGEECRLTD